MEPLQFGKYYHLYNRGNNRDDLFCTPDNYQHFLRLYDKYISPVADTFAWVLMKNHFHLLVRIREEGEIGYYKPLNSDGSIDSVRFQTITYPNLSESEGPDRGSKEADLTGGDRKTTDRGQAHCQGKDALSAVFYPDSGLIKHLQRKPDPTRQFSHLFNAYAQSYNKAFGRTGSLFERPFHRIEVTSERYFRQLIVYIHANPQHHGFTSDFKDYPWSSYGTILSVKPTRLSRDKVLGWFDDRANFVEVHKQKVDREMIKDLIME